MDAVILTHNIDQPFISQLESKNEGVKFMRIDADVTDSLKAKTSKKAQEEMEAQAETISKIMKKALKKGSLPGRRAAHRSSPCFCHPHAPPHTAPGDGWR